VIRVRDTKIKLSMINDNWTPKFNKQVQHFRF
jgi:hypothetical protein